MILKKYTNELLKVIIEEGLDVKNFTLGKAMHSKFGDSVQIFFKNSDLYFIVTPASLDNFDEFCVSYNKFLPSYPVDTGPYDRYNIDTLKQTFKNWLNTHVSNYLENINETDYWEIIKNNPLTIDGIDFTKNVPFSKEEQEQLKIGLEEIKLLLSRNFGLNAQQIESTNKRIDYLIAATERLNKTDWKAITISTIFSITYDLSFDEHKRSMLFGLFSKLWAFVQHLPPI